jgi:predicted metal-binding membrane protein
MMLPAVAPVAALYAATLRRRRAARLLAFAGGYLAVWAATAGPAYALSTLVDDGVAPHPLARRLTAAAIFACCGVYQLTPLKERCLRHCRSPLAQLLRYASFTGRARDLRVGAFHAAYCLGCCWALMLLLVAFGTMSLGAALALAALVAAEKLTPWGPAVARLAGWAALALAVTALVVPGVAPGLAPSDMAPMTGG